MISHRGVRESPEFLHPEPIRHLERCDWFFPVLRQGLHPYLEALQETPKRRRALLPDYVPEGIYDPFLRLGWEVSFYEVDLNLGVDAEALARSIESHRPDAFVYIHYFGVRHAGNLQQLRGLIPPGTLFIEDFAHTIPHRDLEVSGAVSAFSYTKMIGVTEGSLLWIHDRAWMRKCSYAADDALSRTLHSRLRWHRRVESLAGCGTHRYLMSAVRRTLGHRRDYYSHLMEHYPQLRVRVDSGSADHLNRVNFDRVFERRRELATLYLDELDERLRFPLPDASFTGQALLAFPVRVADQMAFHRHLRRGGIEGYWLADRWWFQDRPPSELFRHHYLLPLHHGLTDGEVRRVAVRANQFAAEAALQGRPVMRAASR